MVGVVTITAKTGPDIQVTSKVISNVATLLWDLTRGVLFITTNEEPAGSAPQQEYSLTGVATVTCTISGTTFTWTIS